MDNARESTSSIRLYDLDHLSTEFLQYLDDIIGAIVNDPESNGYGKIEIEIANRKVVRIWHGISGKAGYQF